MYKNVVYGWRVYIDYRRVVWDGYGGGGEQNAIIITVSPPEYTKIPLETRKKLRIDMKGQEVQETILTFKGLPDNQHWSIMLRYDYNGAMVIMSHTPNHTMGEHVWLEVKCSTWPLDYADLGHSSIVPSRITPPQYYFIQVSLYVTSRSLSLCPSTSVSICMCSSIWIYICFSICLCVYRNVGPFSLSLSLYSVSLYGYVYMRRCEWKGRQVPWVVLRRTNSSLVSSNKEKSLLKMTGTPETNDTIGSLSCSYWNVACFSFDSQRLIYVHTFLYCTLKLRMLSNGWVGK